MPRHRKLKRRHSPVPLILPPLLGITLLVAAAAGVLVSRRPGDPGSTVGFLMGIVGAGVAMLFLPATGKLRSYYTTQAVVIVFLLVAVGASGPFPMLQALLVAAGILELVLIEPYPGNLFFTLGITAAATAVRLLTNLDHRFFTEMILKDHLPFLVITALVASVGSLMTKHREVNVTLGDRKRQLEESVIELAKANAAFQDVAVDARERATESERQRITRDIHDIIGYTLTNNMMLMEAAQDLMKENALALPGIIEQARSNAEEGLRRIRAAMYRLRQEEVPHASGLDAVARLIRIFEHSTAVAIRYDFSNAPRSISEQVDSAVYHLVQEALVNAFRHGNATEVRIQLWYTGTELRVHLMDNGKGADSITEGIGISGMRERVEALDGTLRIQPLPGGFEVAAHIPVRLTSQPGDIFEQRAAPEAPASQDHAS